MTTGTRVADGSGRERPRASARWVERGVVVALCLAIGWFYGWTVWSTGKSLRIGKEQRDYYNLLIDGWLAGQLHMKVEVPEALLKLRDPYDPEQRPPGLGLHDASLYRGKYYVYFGVAPAVTLMLPFRVVTGVDLPLHGAVLVFVYGGFLAGVGMVLAVRRRYFPEASSVVVGAAVVTLGLAALGQVLLRRPDMWELPIAGGYFFAMLTLGAVWRSVHGESAPARARWLAVAGLTLGLAVASRPTYLFATPLLVVPVAAWWWTRRVVPWREALHGVVPLACVGLAMAGHNYARFGNPLHFGQAYQLSLDYESKLPHFQARYVPYNLKQHFFDAARWERYFPFVRPAALAPAPEGYTQHRGDVFGVVTNLPVLALALLAPLAIRRREVTAKRAIATWLASVAVLFGATAGVMCLFFSALARYQLDFVPTLALLAAVGLLALERELVARTRAAAVGGRVALMALAGWSGVFGMLYSVQVDGLLKERNPGLLAALARTANWVPAVLERIAGVRFGPVELRVRLDEARTVGEEALLRVGDGGGADRVLVRYLREEQVQFGFQRGEALGQWSAPLRLPRDAVHRIEVSLGSLFPPATHPFFHNWSSDRVQRARRCVWIAVNDRRVLDGYYRFAGSGAVIVGRAAGFTGVVESVARGLTETSEQVLRRAQEHTPSGTIRLRVTWPRDRAGQREPLVVTGQAGAADFLFVEYLDEKTVRIGFDHWGGPGLVSEALRVDFAAEQVIEATMGSLNVVSDADMAPPWRTGRLRVAVNGIVALEAEREFYTVELGEVRFGENVVGGTSCGARFTGAIRAVEAVGAGR